MVIKVYPKRDIKVFLSLKLLTKRGIYVILMWHFCHIRLPFVTSMVIIVYPKRDIKASLMWHYCHIIMSLVTSLGIKVYPKRDINVSLM